MLEESLTHICQIIEREWAQELVEVVVVDDSTVAPASEVILPFLHKNIQVTYTKNPVNLGWINTVTIGNYVHGSYMLLLADDDRLVTGALKYLINILSKKEIDIFFHKPYFSEQVNVLPEVEINPSANLYSGIASYISDLHHRTREYKDLISLFSFYSSIIVRTTYRQYALEKSNTAVLKENSFPHEIVAFYDLKDKKIAYSEQHLVVGRLLNESYPSSTKLITHLTEVMNYIEQQNSLSHLSERQDIKRTCIQWRSRTIRLGIVLKTLWIDYKNNALLKKLYYIYKTYLQ